MPSAEDLESFKRLKNDTTQTSMPTPPALPQDLKDRFPSMVAWEQAFMYWAETQLGAKIVGQV